MKSVGRWMTKNRRKVRLLNWLQCFGVCIICKSILGCPLWATTLIALVLVFVEGIFVTLCIAKMFAEPEKALKEKCDPYPYLHEMEEQLGYNYKGEGLQLVQMDYCVALRHIGQYQKAWEILRGIHIDKYPGMYVSSKIIYYNNLADILTLMEKYGEAEIWHKKALQLYQDLPENRRKRKMAVMVDISIAESWYRQGEYKQARECLQKIPHKDMKSRVDASLFYARCCTALEEIQEAREHLKFVIDNGNRLYVVEEAKELLAKLEESSDRVEEE